MEGIHLHLEMQHRIKAILPVAPNSQIFSEGNRVSKQVNESRKAKRQKIQQSLTNGVHLQQQRSGLAELPFKGDLRLHWCAIAVCLQFLTCNCHLNSISQGRGPARTLAI